MMLLDTLAADNPLRQWLLEGPKITPQPNATSPRQLRVISMFKWHLRRYLAGNADSLDRVIYLGNLLIIQEPRRGRGLLGLSLRELQNEIEDGEFYEIMRQYEQAIAVVEKRLDLFLLLDLVRMV